MRHTAPDGARRFPTPTATCRNGHLRCGCVSRHVLPKHPEQQPPSHWHDSQPEAGPLLRFPPEDSHGPCKPLPGGHLGCLRFFPTPENSAHFRMFLSEFVQNTLVGVALAVTGHACAPHPPGLLWVCTGRSVPTVLADPEELAVGLLTRCAPTQTACSTHVSASLGEFLMTV